jgi:uncharacterized repeat protein (TIGR03803 family)
MRGKKLSSGLRAAMAILSFTSFMMCTAASQATGPYHFKLLHSFNGTDGNNPSGGLILDAAGNLYGATGGGRTVPDGGGLYGMGTVFELSPTSAGGWSETVLHNFGSRKNDGVNPNAPLIFDTAGNIYGTTTFGGDHASGTVFKLTPPAPGGTWKETVLYNFFFDRTTNSGPTGEWPGSMIFDPAGNLYGTTLGAGVNLHGAVFKMTPTVGGSWTLTVLYSFLDRGDGIQPSGSLSLDAVGNLYGTTESGGSTPCGTVYELTPAAGEDWTKSLLHDFSRADGCYPILGGLVFDDARNLYGSTLLGGSYNLGTVFELSPTPAGGYAETVLHSFGGPNDGIWAQNGVIRDAAGNLFGTTNSGGLHNDGIVFELTPTAGGSWTKKVLYEFNGTDGAAPAGGLVLDATGNLYGTTATGGSYGNGTVFELSP